MAPVHEIRVEHRGACLQIFHDNSLLFSPTHNTQMESVGGRREEIKKKIEDVKVIYGDVGVRKKIS